MARRRRHFVESAVDAVTDFEFVLERLEMNVAGAILNRLEQDQIDEANNRGRVCIRFHIRGRGFVAAQAEELAGFAELLEDFLHAGSVAAIVALDPLLDLLGRGDDDVNVFAKRKAEIVRRPQVERIDERDGDAVIARAERQGAMKPRQTARDETEDFRRKLLLFAQRDVFRA